MTKKWLITGVTAVGVEIVHIALSKTVEALNSIVDWLDRVVTYPVIGFLRLVYAPVKYRASAPDFLKWVTIDLSLGLYALIGLGTYFLWDTWLRRKVTTPPLQKHHDEVAAVLQ